MKFKYAARTKTGEPQVGFVEGMSKEAALSLLQGNELYVLSLEAEQKRRWLEPFAGFFERVREVDLMVFTRQLATMLSAQIPLGDALKSLHRHTKNRILQEVIFEIGSDVDAGLSLSQAMERHPNVFSTFYVNLVRTAEATGRLDDSVSYLADYLENQVGLMTKVRNALIYPSVLVVLSFSVAMLLIVLVLPRLEPAFSEAGVTLPLYTRIIFGIGGFIANWWIAIFAFLFLVAVLVFDYFRSSEGRIVYDELIVKAPVIGKIFRMIYVTRFSNAASILIKGGIPITQALEISSHTIDNHIYNEILHEAAESVRRGEPMSRYFEQNEFYFPSLVGQMILVGETTGRLEQMLDKISKFYMREVDSLVSNLVELIQPIIIVGIGIFVGLLFASVLIPIYNLTQAIGAGAF